MKRIKFGAVMLLMAVPLFTANLAEAQAQRRNPIIIGVQGAPVQPTNTAAWAVFYMLRAGVETNVVFAYIDSTAAPFGLTVADIMALRARGMPGDVLAAMLRHDALILQRQPYGPPVQATSVDENAETAEFEDQQQFQEVQAPQTGVANEEFFVSGGWFAAPDDQRRGRNWQRHTHERPQRPNPGLGSPFASGSVPGPVTPIKPVVPLLQPTVPLIQPVVPLIQSPKPGAPSSR